MSAGALPEHLPSLDGARGLAIVMVIANNITNLDDVAPGLPRLMESAMNAGWVGVQLFFVLSGFLITRILLQSQRSPTYFRSFYARRALRIFPIYYATLFILFVLLAALNALPAIYQPDRDRQVWLWLYLVNWTEPFYETKLPHFWSLAVEEQFYLLWPFVVHKCSSRQVLWVSGAVVVVALLIRIGMRASGQPSEAVYMFSVCRMDALAFGAGAAALTQTPHWQKIVALGNRRLSIAAGAIFVAGIGLTHGLYPRSSVLGQTLGYGVLALVFTLVIVAAAVADQVDAARPRPKLHRFLRWPPLRTLGKYSYGIYIIHRPIHDLVGKPWLISHGLLPTNSPFIALAYVAVSTAVSLLVAAVIFHGFEIHFLRLKRYFTPARVAS